MSASKGNRVPRRRHKHTISPDHNPQVSATTPPHRHSQRATAAPSASSSSYTWQDLRKDHPAKKRATIATPGSSGTTTRPAKGGMGYLMTGGVAAGMKTGMSTHHPLFLPQIGVPKPRGMRQEANRRNLHYVLLRIG